jgi:transposase
MKPTLQDKVNRTIEDLRSLRDEVRLNIHLAGMDAKSGWQKLEQQIEDADRRATEAGKKASHEVAESLRKLRGAVKAFRDRLQGEKTAPPPGA